MLRSWLRHLLGGTNKSRRSNQTQRPARLRVEVLESRELLSGTPLFVDPHPSTPTNPLPPVVLTQTVNPNLSVSQSDVNLPFTATVTNYPGLGSIASMPNWLTATQSGGTITFHGTPTLPGIYTIRMETITITGPNTELDTSGTAAISINAAPTLGTLGGAYWAAGQAGSDTIPVNGGTGPFSHPSVTGVAGLTAGVSGNTITVSGTPASAGTFPITVSVQDSDGVIASQKYNLTVNLSVNPGAIPAATAGNLYSTTFAAAGGSGHYSYALTLGPLPLGMQLSTAGVLSGTATVAGNYVLTVQATDTVNPGVTGSQTYDLVVNPAAPSQLVFLTQPPSTVVAGTTFYPFVKVMDRFNNPVEGVAINMAISPGTFSSGPTSIVSDGHGTAYYGLTENKAGNYTLTASVPGFVSTQSTPFTVTPGAATQLEFATQPPPAVVSATPFGAVVQAEDQFKNPTTKFAPGTAVTMSLSRGMLNSPATANTVPLDSQGRAAFVGLSENTVGTYTLTASSTGLQSAMSNSFMVTAGAASKLVFTTTPPSSVVAGNPFGAVVQVEDAQNNATTAPAGLAVTMGISPGMLSPSTANSVTPNNQGQATFTGLTETKAGTYSLTASAPGLTSAVFSNFTVNPGPTSTWQVKATSPTTVHIGDSITLTVATQDQYGNATHDSSMVTLTSSNGLVVAATTVQLNNGTGSKTLTAHHSGMTTLTASVSGTVVVGPGSGAPQHFGSVAVTVNRVDGDFVQVQPTTGASRQGNVSARLIPNGNGTSVEFDVVTPTGRTVTKVFAGVAYAISPNGRVGIVIPAYSSGTIPNSVILVNLVYDPVVGDASIAQVGSLIQLPAQQFWFSKDDSLLAIVSPATPNAVYSAAVLDTITGAQIPTTANTSVATFNDPTFKFNLTGGRVTVAHDSTSTPFASWSV
jgi:hypothetical protein